MAVEHIMRLEGWESLDVVLRYTRSVKFDESLKLDRDWRGFRRVFLAFCVNNAISVKSEPFYVYRLG